MITNEDSDGLLRKALAVDGIPDDFNPNKIPETGEEYIHFVMYEAKRCKEWVRADIDERKIKHKQATVQEPEGCMKAPIQFMPSVDWQRRQVADFSAFRDHINKIRLNVTEYAPFNGEAEQWARKCCVTPNVTDLITLQQKSLCKVLKFHLDWLDELKPGEMFDSIRGTWLYALLVCLELPLMPETCANLRELARKCSQIRANLHSDTNCEDVKPLNLLIALVARYFHNLDLIDNNNEL